MKLIVGLGNPGKDYADTRHNAGFRVVELLGVRHNLSPKRNRLRSIHGKGVIAGEQVLLAMPQTFMNNSGDAVARLAHFYQLHHGEDLLVVCDDITLDLGVLRLRPSGSDGGHKGLRSIIAYARSEDFPRLRLGVGIPPSGVEATDYVLSSFKASELKTVEEMVDRAANAVEYWLQQGTEATMSRYNG